MKMYKADTDEKQKDTFDEYTTRDQPVAKSFYEKFGFDERDGPPEEEEDE